MEPKEPGPGARPGSRPPRRCPRPRDGLTVGERVVAKLGEDVAGPADDFCGPRRGRRALPLARVFFTAVVVTRPGRTPAAAVWAASLAAAIWMPPTPRSPVPGTCSASLHTMMSTSSAPRARVARDSSMSPGRLDRQVDPVSGRGTPESTVRSSRRAPGSRRSAAGPAGWSDSSPEMERLVAVSELLEAGLPGGADRNWT